jgi:5-formyltetrahydrofolate cyclo-ligase
VPSWGKVRSRLGGRKWTHDLPTLAAGDEMDHIPYMEAKLRLREEARIRRENEPDRLAKSTAIHNRLIGLPEYQEAGVVSSYVGIGSEVRTRELLEVRLARKSPTAVVYRDGATLGMCLIGSLDELKVNSFDLFEPSLALRSEAARQCPPGEVDVFLIPGLAFDLTGGRLGYGRGYYDSLLTGARPRSTLIGLAFDCQIVDRVPMTGHDVAVGLIVTESGVHRLSPG